MVIITCDFGDKYRNISRKSYLEFKEDVIFVTVDFG